MPDVILKKSVGRFDRKIFEFFIFELKSLMFTGTGKITIELLYMLH